MAELSRFYNLPVFCTGGVTDQIRPSGSFSGERRTVRRLRRIQWKRYAIDRADHHAWTAAGARDYTARARELALELARTHRPKPLDAGLDASLRELI
jgi:trimethylamine:corrinoid methyltransferase-like protein